MATEMTNEDQINMVGLFRSFAKMDGRTCGNWVLKFSGEYHLNKYGFEKLRERGAVGVG